MKNRLLAFLVSKAGGVLTPIIATVVASGVSRMAILDPALANQVNQVELTAFLVAAIISLVNYFTNKEQVAGVKQIQALVATDEDGVAGPVTYTEVRRAIAAKPETKKRRKK